jgi:hypothetical protein
MKTPSALNNRSAKAQQSFRIVECSGRPGLRAVRNTLPNIFNLPHFRNAMGAENQKRE